MLQIQPIPAFNDNYIWLITRPGSREACVVDPGDAVPVIATLEALGLELTSILVTHHHFDHVGGLPELAKHGSPTVIGPTNPAIEAIDRRVVEGDTVEVLGAQFEVLAVPGHTLDHIAYFHAGEPPLLFCGDTLFAGGCGRLFEGTAEVMHHSLQKLARLPAATQVYCAHEYTLANLRFALAVEPGNARLQARQSDAQQMREQEIPTVPSTLSDELATNPFMRCGEASIVNGLRANQRLEGERPEQVFAGVRAWKDVF